MNLTRGVGGAEWTDAFHWETIIFFFFLLISFWSELPSKTAGDAYVCIHLHAVQKRAALRARRGAEHRGGR